MKIMIFRTFAHTRIWEGTQPNCTYNGRSLDIITTWEPNIMDINLNDAIYGLGIYTSTYYTFRNRNGENAFNGTVEETHPSLLKLKPTHGNADDFMEYQNGYLKCFFELDKKLDLIDRTAMAELDEALVSFKRRNAGNIQEDIYDSLYFSLEYDDVANILTNYDLNIPI